MFPASHSQSNSRAAPHRQRAATLRPQVEMLEDRLAPSATLSPVPLGTVQPAIPVVEAAWESSSTTRQTNAILTIDLAALGLAGTTRIAIAFHYTVSPLTVPALQFYDAASNSWQPVQGSTQVADSLVVNADRGTITVVFDATSNPALSNLQGAFFRLAGSGVLTSAIPTATVSQATTTIFQSVDAVFASPNFDAFSLVPTDTRPLDDHGVGLYYVDHATIDVVANAQSAMGPSDEHNNIQPASAAEPSTGPEDEPKPPLDPNSPDAASNSFTFQQSVAGDGDQATTASEPSESIIDAPSLPRELVVERVVNRGGPSHMLLVAMVFGWASTHKDIRNNPASKRVLASCWLSINSMRTKPRHHPATVPRAPPGWSRQRNGKGQTAWSALFCW